MKAFALANKHGHPISEKGRSPVGHLGNFRKNRDDWVTKSHIFEMTETQFF